MTTVAPIPSRPMDSPESTEVTMNAIPWTIPTSPLALARLSGSTRMVTVVARAMLRMFSTTAPMRVTAANPQNHGPSSRAIRPSGARRKIAPASRNITRVNSPAKRITTSLRYRSTSVPKLMELRASSSM